MKKKYKINSCFSVLLSVYYKEDPHFLNEALESIWTNQTVKPTQIALVQDGPLTPDLETILVAWKEKLGDVLTLIPLEKNVDLAAALNEGLKYCQHELVARMDTDDVAMPTRFEKQIAFMQQKPEIAASRKMSTSGVCQASCPISYAANTTFLSNSLLSFDGFPPVSD